MTLEDSEPTDATVRTVSPGSAQFAGALEKNPMIFSFQDGQVEHVCPMDGEESWVLNVKRGILSGLQNSMKNLTASQAVYEVIILILFILNTANKSIYKLFETDGYFGTL